MAHLKKNGNKTSHKLGKERERDGVMKDSERMLVNKQDEILKENQIRKSKEREREKRMSERERLRERERDRTRI